MSDDELLAFLDEQDKVVCATHGPRGLPHLTMLGYVRRGERVWAWSYGKAQKVRNLERDPRATLLVEAGATYEDYRGAMLECDVALYTDAEVVRDLGLALLERYDTAALADAVEAQVAKRVALEFIPRWRSSYDHRKLRDGGYRAPAGSSPRSDRAARRSSPAA